MEQGTLQYRIVRALWGDLSGEELKKFIFLAAASFCLIGAFWPLKPLRETIFLDMVGSAHLLTAKQVTVVFCVPLVYLYTKLVDFFSKQALMYAVLAIFSSLGLFFAYAFADPVMGVANTTVNSNRIIAWAFYLFVDSYLTIMMTIFWSFVSDITTTESAKKGYGMIVFGSQSGGLLFSFLSTLLIADTTQYVSRVPVLIFLSIGLFVTLGLVIWMMTRTLSPEALQGETKDTPSVGFFEGMKTLLVHPYVTALFGLVVLQEGVTTIMDYQFRCAIEAAYAVGSRASFIFGYSLVLQIIACAFAFFGTSFVHRTFGTRACLVAYPVALLAVTTVYYFTGHPYILIGYMLIAKSLHYALNQPVKDSLYTVTSREIKYKSKAWIDAFGMRFSKYGGSELAKHIGRNTQTVALSVMGGVVLWIVLAYGVGTRNERAARKGTVIS